MKKLIIGLLVITTLFGCKHKDEYNIIPTNKYTFVIDVNKYVGTQHLDTINAVAFNHNDSAFKVIWVPLGGGLYKSDIMYSSDTFKINLGQLIHISKVGFQVNDNLSCVSPYKSLYQEFINDKITNNFGL